MCLTTNLKSRSIAEEDIVVFKVLLKKGKIFKRYRAPCYDFTYRKKRQYKTEFKIRESFAFGDGTINIENGFHSFDGISDAVAFGSLEVQSQIPHSKIAICKFIIPKGSIYYTGDYTVYSPKNQKILNCISYASNAIKFIEEVKDVSEYWYHRTA